MTNTRDDGTADGGIPEQPHAVITRWAVVECRRPGSPATTHIVGTIVAHARLSASGENDGEPYIARALASLDLDARRAVNACGKLVVLKGNPLPPDTWPAAYDAMTRRAEAAWGLPQGTTWHRFA